MVGPSIRQLSLAAIAALFLGTAALANTPAAQSAPAAHEPYSDDEVAKAASDFFSTGAKELSQLLEKVLKEKGHPVAIVRGEEAGGALGVGLRYGRGELVFKGVPARKVYWQGGA